MQHDLESVSAELRTIGNVIALSPMMPDEKQHFVGEFHRLLAVQNRLRRNRPQIVYFIHAPSASLIKIGRTSNIDSRLSSLRMASPAPLVLLGTFAGGVTEEAALHRRWSSIRRHGEWFKATSELFAEIEGVVFDSTRAAA